LITSFDQKIEHLFEAQGKARAGGKARVRVKGRARAGRGRGKADRAGRGLGQGARLGSGSRAGLTVLDRGQGVRQAGAGLTVLQIPKPIQTRQVRGLRGVRQGRGVKVRGLRLDAVKA
jgi:hypothetical protein